MTALGHFITGTHMMVEVKQLMTSSPRYSFITYSSQMLYKHNMQNFQIASSHYHKSRIVLIKKCKNVVIPNDFKQTIYK